ncbi:MAG: hypothetical protein ACLSAF_10225 [Intestinimonas sp.]
MLLESLRVPQEVLAACARPLVEAGHTFHAYAREDDPQTQIARARDADVLMIANMPSVRRGHLRLSQPQIH